MFINAQPPPIVNPAVPSQIILQPGNQGRPLQLQPHQIVQATVAEGGMDKVILNLKQQQMEAQTKVPLKSGQKIHLQVMSTRPQVHFKIVEEAELKHLFRALPLLGRSSHSSSLPHQLQSLVNQLQTGLPSETQSLLAGLTRLLGASPQNISGKDLSQLWHQLGLDFEALLAGDRGSESVSGLKPLLYKLLCEPAVTQQREIPDRLEQLLDQVKLYQLCRSRLSQENTLFLPLPFAFLEQGYLLAEQDAGREENDEENDQSWKFTVNVQLTALGNLQVLLLFEKQELRLRILCEDRETMQFLSEALAGLQENLAGFTLRSYSVGLGAEAPMKAPVERLAPHGEHFLETHI